MLRGALNEYDPELSGHNDEVAALAVALARRLALDEDEIERVAIAAELHDIGKIAIPRSILDKPGPLDADEWAFMRRHTLIGERIAQSAPALIGVAALIRSSHERWDGAGYPDGLAGRRHPARRPDRLRLRRVLGHDQRPLLPAAMSHAEARAELRRDAGTQFAPAVVEAFLAGRTATVPAAA